MRTYLIVPAVTDIAGQCRIVLHPNFNLQEWQPPSAALGSAIDRLFGDEENEFVPCFHSRSPAGVALRKAWCEHLAREIEREYGLEPNPYILEEH